MIKRSENDWQEIISDWRQSGLGLTEYCRQKKLPLSSFHKWSRKIGDNQTQEDSSPLTGFVEVMSHDEPVVTRLMLKITTASGCKVEVPL